MDLLRPRRASVDNVCNAHTPPPRASSTQSVHDSCARTRRGETAAAAPHDGSSDAVGDRSRECGWIDEKRRTLRSAAGLTACSRLHSRSRVARALSKEGVGAGGSGWVERLARNAFTTDSCVSARWA